MDTEIAVLVWMINDPKTRANSKVIDSSVVDQQQEWFFSARAMSEYWDLKIVADSEEEVRAVLAEVAEQISVEPAEVRIALYPKFPRMWECVFTIPSKSISDPIVECAERFAKLGTPSWENYWRDSSRPRERKCYEAIADVRRHLFAVDRVFWAHVYCEARVPRNSSEPDDTQSDNLRQ